MIVSCRVVAGWVLLPVAIAVTAVGQTPAQYYELAVQARSGGDAAQALGHLRMALDLRPDFPAAHAEIGALYLSLGRPEDAERHLQRARSADPSLVGVAMNLARLFARSDRHADALALYRETTAGHPDMSGPHLGAAFTLQALGRYADAIRSYARALELAPESAAAMANMASCHEALGDDDEAIGLYLRALEADGDSSMAHGNLGAIYRNRGMVDESRPLLARAVELDPSFTMARYRLALTLIDTRDFDAAVGHLERVVAEQPDHIGGRYNLARGYFRLRRVEEGRREMSAYRRLNAIAVELEEREAAVVMRPSSALKQYELGMAYEKHGRHGPARGAYTRALELDEDYADAHYRLGVLALRTGSAEESETHHRRALALAPESVGLRVALAGALLAQDDLAGALAEYTHALTLDGRNATALAGVGAVSYRREEWPVAERHYRAALDADPQAHWAMDGLARTRLARGGDPEEALELAKSAYGLVAAPRYLETAALAYFAMGDRASARIAASTAVRMDPENDAYRRTLARVTTAGPDE